MFRKYGLYFGWLFACLGILGSLYFSEIRHLEPCHLCWYQRTFLFPLALILGFGAFFGDRRAIQYGLPFAILGIVFAGYQILIQQIPDWNPIDMCGSGPRCTEKINIGLGFITIPMLSGLNFVMIASCLTGLVFSSKKQISK